MVKSSSDDSIARVNFFITYSTKKGDSGPRVNKICSSESHDPGAVNTDFFLSVVTPFLES